MGRTGERHDREHDQVVLPENRWPRATTAREFNIDMQGRSL